MEDSLSSGLIASCKIEYGLLSVESSHKFVGCTRALVTSTCFRNDTMNKLFGSFAKSEKDGIIKFYSQALAEYFHQYEQHKVSLKVSRFIVQIETYLLPKS